MRKIALRIFVFAVPNLKRTPTIPMAARRRRKRRRSVAESREATTPGLVTNSILFC